MRKRFLTASVLACILLIGLFAMSAFAKSQPKPPTPAERMAIYSPPNKKTGTANHARKSRINQQNIVAEAANVLNVLPIDIINEMNKGKTLVQVAKEKGLTETEFNKKLTDFDKTLTDAAVKDGTISKEHADAINTGRTDRIKNGMKQKSMKVSNTSSMDMGNN